MCSPKAVGPDAVPEQWIESDMEYTHGLPALLMQAGDRTQNLRTDRILNGAGVSAFPETSAGLKGRNFDVHATYLK